MLQLNSLSWMMSLTNAPSRKCVFTCLSIFRYAIYMSVYVRVDVLMLGPTCDFKFACIYLCA